MASVGAVGCSSPSSSVAPVGKPAAISRPATPLATAAPLTPLPRSLHPAARPERDLGRMDPTLTLTDLGLLFDRSPAQKRRLAHDLVAIQDPTSPTYHRWLTPTEFGARYGASPSDVARATAWLRAQGFAVRGVSPAAGRLSFTGTVGQVEQAFETEVHRYQLRGEANFALSRAPSVPADLGTFVAGLHGAHNFRPEPPRPRRGTAGPDFKFNGALALAPADFATIYDVNPLYAANITGQGLSVAITGASGYNTEDITAFRTNFGLDATNLPTDVLIPNTGSGVVDAYYFEETELDLEWSGAIAKDAQVVYVYAGEDASDGVDDALYYAVEQRVAPVVSFSYGGCELGYTPADVAFYGTVGDLAAMVGVTVVIASGDTGPAECEDYVSTPETAATLGMYVSFPASIPSVVAVGGTEFSFTSANQSTYWDSSGNARTYIPEEAWDEALTTAGGALAASGGGYSILFPRPYWQAAALPTSSFRGVPDVSFSAAVYGVPYLISTSWTAADGSGQPITPEGLVQIGGTSASAPSFAGLLTLLNQSVDAANPGLGNINPTLYALYASVPAAFHDITMGSNKVPCEPGTPDCPTSGTPDYGYSAGPGYDLATGLGSVDAAKLVAAWTALTPTSTKLSVSGMTKGDSGTAEGTPLQFAATVGLGATSSPGITGKVTFYFETVDGSGNPDLGYVLGEVAVTSDLADGGTEGATAILTAPAPAGLTGAAQVVAFYGGDSSYRASYSTASSVSTDSSFTITPPSITLQPNQQTTFSASTVAPPVTWVILSNGTCNSYEQGCSGSLQRSPTSVGFQAGANPGTVILEAIDSDFAAARVTITVAGTPVDGGELIPPDAGKDSGHPADAAVDTGAKTDASPPPVEDAGHDTGAAADAASDTGHGKDGGRTARDASKEEDSGERDASKADAAESSSSSGGCTVATPGHRRDAGAFGVMVIALASLLSRRRRDRA